MNGSAKCDSDKKTSSIERRKRASAISPVTFRRSSAPAFVCACAALLISLLLQTRDTQAAKRYGARELPRLAEAELSSTNFLRGQYNQLLDDSLGTAATCGLRGQTKIHGEPRIIGGTTVKDASDWPWMVSIYKKDLSDESARGKFVCGGTLISNNGWVLTAAGCIPDSSERNRYRLRVQLATTKIYNSEKKLYNVKRAVVHPDFSLESFSNDIGLLLIDLWNEKLPRDARPVCLPVGPAGKRFDFTDHQANIIGWGVTKSTSTQLEKDSAGSSRAYSSRRKVYPSKKLNEAYTTLISTNDCARRWRGKAIIKDSMLCTDDPSTDGAPCAFDWGSPLVWHSESPRSKQENEPQMDRARFFQIGVVTFESEFHCGTKELPAVYTRVASHISWIVSTIRQNKL